MKKKIQVWLPLLFSITMIVGMYFGYKMRDNIPGKSFFFTEKRRPIQEIMDLINSRYVDDVQIDRLSDTAIQAILSQLDPHSVFIPAEELRQVNEDLAGKFFGIGIEFSIIDDTLHVINVLKDGPGFTAGLLTGDKFIEVDGKTVAGNKTTADAFRNMLRGSRGTEVRIAFLRGSQKKQTTISRDAIPLHSVDASYMISNETGFIRLNKFSSVTYREFMEALEKLNKAGMNKLILDLRGNGGGILDEAVEIADEFLAGDKLITYTQGAHADKKEYRCRRNGQFENGTLVVLADEGTASASEILIGALQDWDRATIIGRQTFGKGLVQEQFELSDHSALRLTIARYFTPVGRSIQRPYNEGNQAYYEEINNRINHSQVPDSQLVNKVTGKIFKTQGGKTIYDKGGISPDYFVAVDTAGFSVNSIKLYNNNTVGNFAYRYYLQNVEQLKRYQTPADFNRQFVFDELQWNRFVAEAAKDSVNIEHISSPEKNRLINRIRASIARQVWRNEGYFQVSNTQDAGLQKALQILSAQKYTKH